MRRKIKALLLRVLGEGGTAYFQALQFVRLLASGRYFDKSYEFYEPELDLLPRLLNPGDIAVDVGALGANWTYAMHRVVGRSGFVFAFEAHPFHARSTAIAMTLMKMRSTRLFPFGLSNRQEEALLRVRDADGQRCEGESAIEINAPQESASYATIKLKTLDSMVVDHPRLTETRLMKIDVEGHELFVLQGAQVLIRQARPYVILEKGAFEEQGYTCREVHAFFVEMGYRAFASVAGEAMAPTDTMLERHDAVGPNRIFVPEEKLDDLSDLIRA